MQHFNSNNNTDLCTYTCTLPYGHACTYVRMYIILYLERSLLLVFQLLVILEQCHNTLCLLPH